MALLDKLAGSKLLALAAPRVSQSAGVLSKIFGVKAGATAAGLAPTPPPGGATGMTAAGTSKKFLGLEVGYWIWIAGAFSIVGVLFYFIFKRRKR